MAVAVSRTDVDLDLDLYLGLRWLSSDNTMLQLDVMTRELLALVQSAMAAGPPTDLYLLKRALQQPNAEYPRVLDLGLGSFHIVLDLTPIILGGAGVAGVARLLWLFERYRNVRLRVRLEEAQLEEAIASLKENAAEQREAVRIYEGVRRRLDAGIAATDATPIEAVLTADLEDLTGET